MNFKTIQNMTCDIFNNLNQIPHDIDLIVGVPRSGMLAASIIALDLNLPLTDIDSFLEGKIYGAGDTKKNKHWISKPDEARKILIVEDSVYTGNSIKKIREKLDGLFDNKIVYYAVYVISESKHLIDIYCEICETPRMFEWNCFHHQHINEVCFDIDGVLCRDPSNDENDDGEGYFHFISSVEPLVIPTFTIGYIITSRLEKYRTATEAWLEKNGIKYNEMIMMQFTSKEERIRSGSHGSFKGEAYKRLRGTSLFIESDPNQAQEIANISGKGVFCVGNHTFYDEGMYTQMKNGIKKKIGKLLPESLKNIVKKALK